MIQLEGYLILYLGQFYLHFVAFGYFLITNVLQFLIFFFQSHILILQRRNFLSRGASQILYINIIFSFFSQLLLQLSYLFPEVKFYMLTFFI